MEEKKKTEKWEYSYQSKLRRIERLKEQGVVNPWSVANGTEKPRDYYVVEIKKEGRITLPAKFRKQIGVGYGDKFKITIDENKLILEVYNGK